MKKSEIIVKRITKITLIVLAILTILMLIYIVVFFNSCKAKLFTKKSNAESSTFVFNGKTYYPCANIGSPFSNNIYDFEIIEYDGGRWFNSASVEYRKSNCCGDSIIIECHYRWIHRVYIGAIVYINDDFKNQSINLNNLSISGAKESININYNVMLNQLHSEEIIDYTKIGSVSGTIGGEFSYYANLVQSNNKYYMWVYGMEEGKDHIFYKLDDEFINYVNEIEPGSFE